MKKIYTPSTRLKTWWSTYGPNGPISDSGQLAQLRRCRTWDEALIVPCVHSLIPTFTKSEEWQHKNIERYCVMAILAANVKTDDSQSLFGAIAKDSLSHVRFMRVYRATSSNDILREYRNVITLSNNVSNLTELEEFVLYHNTKSTKTKISTTFYT